MVTPEDVLAFWFGESNSLDGRFDDARMQRWFGGGPAFDDEIRARFGEAIEAAASGALDDWAGSPRGRLALVILLDQLPRNAFRATSRAFATDEKAREIVLDGLDVWDDAALLPIERGFFYLPLQHAEDLGLQERGVALYRRLADSVVPEWRKPYDTMLEYAVRHRDVIAKFGRFPHRNPTLDRESTPAETEFLAQPGSSF